MMTYLLLLGRKLHIITIHNSQHIVVVMRTRIVFSFKFYVDTFIIVCCRINIEACSIN